MVVITFVLTITDTVQKPENEYVPEPSVARSLYHRAVFQLTHAGMNISKTASHCAVLTQEPFTSILYCVVSLSF